MGTYRFNYCSWLVVTHHQEVVYLLFGLSGGGCGKKSIDASIADALRTEGFPPPKTMAETTTPNPSRGAAPAPTGFSSTGAMVIAVLLAFAGA